ncbi:MAG: hypothetical protein HC825_01560 [Oscillatoriales cyanobacterium RM1_1_9]|nr:hypothetical protein [Oscillatoriales cyanobacterium RM1_1_9]
MALENLIQRVRAWLPAAQSQLQANVAELEAQLSESDFTSLSPATFADLKTRLETLRSPISYRQTLQDRA